jgi:hypothetical protein
MYKERKEDLSVYYFIEEIFSSTSFITIVDEWPTGEIQPPVISVENELLSVRPLELGNRRGVDIRTWYINIFAKNNSQRDDFAYLIKNEVQSGIPVYDFDEGFPAEGQTPAEAGITQIGTLSWDQIAIKKFPVLTVDNVSKMYYRAQVTISCANNQIS